MTGAPVTGLQSAVHDDPQPSTARFLQHLKENFVSSPLTQRCDAAQRNYLATFCQNEQAASNHPCRSHSVEEVERDRRRVRTRHCALAPEVGPVSTSTSQRRRVLAMGRSAGGRPSTIEVYTRSEAQSNSEGAPWSESRPGPHPDSQGKLSSATVAPCDDITFCDTDCSPVYQVLAVCTNSRAEPQDYSRQSST